MQGEIHHQSIGEPDKTTLDLSHPFEVTALNFPYPILLTEARVGDVLRLKHHKIGNKSGVLVLHQGRVAGFIPVPAHSGLIDSMQKGEGFEAVVCEFYADTCRVQIRPASKSEAS